MFANGPAAFSRFQGRVCLVMLNLSTVCVPDVFSQKNDFDGDGRTDHVVYDPAAGTWYIRQGATLQPRIVQFGWNQSEPVPGDFDGDGRTDLCVFSSRLGTWYLSRSSDGVMEITSNWGSNELDPIAGDFDGDGKTDLALYHPPAGNWYIQRSTDKVRYVVNWGTPEMEPVPGDYDGDRKTDLAVYYRPAGMWFIRNSSNSTLRQVQWGWTEAEPVQADFDGDNRTDIAVFHPQSGTWYILQSATGAGRIASPQWFNVQPMPGYYDGDNLADIAVYDHRFGNWIVLPSTTQQPYLLNWGWSGAEPSSANYRIDDDGLYYGHSYGHDYDDDWFEQNGAYPRIGYHPPPPGPDPSIQVPANFANVEWLHTDVSSWAQTAKLTVTLTSSSIVLNYDKANVWPAIDGVNANPWIFVPKGDGKSWYAATFEWMRPGQTSKSINSVKGDHIKKAPLQDFVPVPGTWYGFMVSGLCRDSKRNVYERSNVYMLQWPAVPGK